jgi:maltooligosyltrehalose trehalohydrolase
MSLVLFRHSPELIPMSSQCGFHTVETEADEGTPYRFRFPDGREFADPASRFQPEGVQGPSVVVDTAKFQWTDQGFAEFSPSQAVIYELHTGTFTEEGTFESAISRLESLADLGVTAIELMPVAQYPGTRNWGYDGVFSFAVQNSYGGPRGLQKFVNAAHGIRLSVILDVVYNHLGPEGNFAGEFGPYFTDRYRTPWGRAMNFDGPGSDPVRAFFIQNALYWLEEFHIDALRLDAVHGIFDFSAHHFLAELKESVEGLAQRSGRKLFVIAESDLNDARFLCAPDRGGYGLDAQWSDDFHHALHTSLTHESKGYYKDFGSLEDLCTVLRDGWLYSGQFSLFRKRRHGNSAAGIAQSRFVVFSQNHDQVGNRAQGERLTQLVDFESLKLAAGVTLLSPFVPLLFMGEEYGETHPFLYFTNHSSPELNEGVRKGRGEEFAAFGWGDDFPDPGDEGTFKRCVLNWAAQETEPHRTLRRFYKTLMGIRKRFEIGEIKPQLRCDESHQILVLEYRCPRSQLAVVFHFGDSPANFPLLSNVHPADLLLNSADNEWLGPVAESKMGAEDKSIQFGRRSVAIFSSSTKGDR